MGTVRVCSLLIIWNLLASSKNNKSFKLIMPLPRHLHNPGVPNIVHVARHI